MKTFGMATRITEIELPYLNSFIRHHKKIGVNVFYFVATRDDEIPLLNAHLSHHANVHVIGRKQCKPDGVRGAMDAALAELETDYVINFDADQYLSLVNHSSLDDLAQQYPRRNIIRFRWVLAVNDEMKGNQLTSGMYGHMYHSMLLTKETKKLNEHEGITKTKKE